MTTWSAANTEPHGEKAEVLNWTPRVHKLTHHLSVHESLLDRTTPIRMMEIGSFYGDSVQMWHEYLHRDSLVLGIDVNSKFVKVADASGIHVRFGEDESASFLKKVTAEFGPFDIILDAGNHTSSHMVDCFRRLFAYALTDNGVYLVENVDCDYRKFYRDRRLSYIDFVRALIDAMHSHYQINHDETNYVAGKSDQVRKNLVPAILPILGSIEIYDSIVVICRAGRSRT